MNNNINQLIERIEQLEQELIFELQKRKIELNYKIVQNKIYFNRDVIGRHKENMLKLRDYIANAPMKHTASAPVIWFCIFPAVLMDAFVSFYQAVCFPLYQIPKVRRSDHINLDRRFLHYLNIIEKLNCLFCSYFVGLISYVQEIAARTEQYWCPIKHSRHLASIHSRYKTFFDYGDDKSYRHGFGDIRKDFSDLG